MGMGDRGFNPHPPVGAGATTARLERLKEGEPVSILTRPWGRVQPSTGAGSLAGDAVSILTRPWGRVQLGVRREDMQRVLEFQSSPARGGGCNAEGIQQIRVPRDVSILTRPWGRVQLP